MQGGHFLGKKKREKFHFIFQKFRNLTQIFFKKIASQTKKIIISYFNFPTFSGGFAYTLCLCFIKSSLYSSWHTCFHWRLFLAPEGSKHNPLSCVLLNQQLKVPVTLFTVLKRIWPVSNTTWKDFRDGSDLCLSLVLSVCSLTYWFSWVYWVWRNVLYCTTATSTMAICLGQESWLIKLHFFIVAVTGVEFVCEWQMEILGMCSFAAGCYIKHDLYTETTRH